MNKESESLPVTVPDLRNALALCVAKFESVAAEFRQVESAAIEDAANAQHLEDADSFRADAARAKGEAESLDRMAASVRALLRAPDAKPGDAEGVVYFVALVDSTDDRQDSATLEYWSERPQTLDELKREALEAMDSGPGYCRDELEQARGPLTLEIFGPFPLDAPQRVQA